jgi:quercetin dioxygenase-like cupin family protein
MSGRLTLVPASQLEPGYAAPRCRASGGAESRLVHPDGYSLWAVEAQLESGCELTWEAPHAEEAVCVVSGELRVGDATCGPLGALVLEADVPAVATATADTRVVHFGAAALDVPNGAELGPPAADDHRCHVVAYEDAPSVRYGPVDDPQVEQHYYADSTCPTCRITIFHVAGAAAFEAGSHFHTQDEIIYVLDGEMRVGREVAGAGAALAIPANLRYGFRTPGPYSFFNYRRDVSYVVSGTNSEPVLETATTSGRPD